MTWQNGVDWGSGLGQYSFAVEFVVMGALMILGALVDGLFRSGKKNTAELDGDD